MSSVLCLMKQISFSGLATAPDLAEYRIRVKCGPEYLELTKRSIQLRHLYMLYRVHVTSQKLEIIGITSSEIGSYP